MAQKKSPFILFIAGTALGLAIGYGLASYFAGSDARVADGRFASAESPRPVVESLQAEIDTLEKENAELRAQVKEGNVAAAEAGKGDRPPLPFVTARGGKMDPEDAIKQMRPHMERFAEMQLAKYQSRLNLTDEQRQAMRDILVLQQEQRHRMMMARQNGEGGANPADLPGGRVTNQDVIDLAKEIMSPEQYQDYAQIQAEERQSRNDMMATARLGQVAPMLGLSDEQKDQAYSIFYTEAESSGDFFDPGSMEERQQKTDQALQQILTPEQQKAYEDYLKNRKDRGGMIFFGG